MLQNCDNCVLVGQLTNEDKPADHHHHHLHHDNITFQEGQPTDHHHHHDDITYQEGEPHHEPWDADRTGHTRHLHLVDRYGQCHRHRHHHNHRHHHPNHKRSKY